ncbi:MAG: hypothetical protein IKU00_10835 [Bacteroidales bacterium]|nr:hypothetical protein [Bacteroidales bacterium]
MGELKDTLGCFVVPSNPTTTSSLKTQPLSHHIIGNGIGLRHQAVVMLHETGLSVGYNGVNREPVDVG